MTGLRRTIIGMAPSELSGIDHTGLLQSRPAREPDYKSENEALSRLAETLATKPDQIAHELASAAMRLTGAGSAGISLEERHNGEHQFRWVATAGALEPYLNGTVPYHMSPCGEVVERNGTLLLCRPARRYAYINELALPVEEVLLVPFHRGGKPAGTVWVVSHDGRKHFDAEDLRLVLSLTRFAAIATQTVGVVNVLRAENRLQEQALAASREEDQRKDNFLAVLSHEMRNPLSAISTAAAVLKQLNQHAAPPQQQALECIARQTAQLQALVDDLTDLASIKSGRVTLHRQALVLQDIVAKALDSCNAALQAKRHRLRVNMPEEPVRLEGDEVKLTQVLVNLFNNAIKYTPPGGDIGLDIQQRHGRVTLSVTDTGVGIPAALLPRIFDMFMQVPRADRPRYSGLGIGLALVEQFVRLHHGTITAHSEGENRGSRFTVDLPCINAATAAQ